MTRQVTPEGEHAAAQHRRAGAGRGETDGVAEGFILAGACDDRRGGGGAPAKRGSVRSV